MCCYSGAFISEARYNGNYSAYILPFQLPYDIKEMFISAFSVFLYHVLQFLKEKKYFPLLLIFRNMPGYTMWPEEPTPDREGLRLEN